MVTIGVRAGARFRSGFKIIAFIAGAGEWRVGFKMTERTSHCCVSWASSSPPLYFAFVFSECRMVGSTRLEPHCCIWDGQAGDLSAVPCYAFAEALDMSAVAPFLRRSGEFSLLPQRAVGIPLVHR